MKKVMAGIVLVVIMSSLVIYNHVQQPDNNDIFSITKSWSPSIEEVFLIREIDGKWLTIFRGHNAAMIAELEQNWLGTWKFRTGGTLSSAYYPPEVENQFTWQASGAPEEQATYYFGMVTDLEIEKMEVEAQNGLFEDVLFIEAKGNRFFFKRVDGPIVMPVNINGFSKSGELIYSSLKKVSQNQD